MNRAIKCGERKKRSGASLSAEREGGCELKGFTSFAESREKKGVEERER